MGAKQKEEEKGSAEKAKPISGDREQELKHDNNSFFLFAIPSGLEYVCLCTTESILKLSGHDTSTTFADLFNKVLDHSI